MNKRELSTPAVLVDELVLARNIKKVQDAASVNGKRLWPMVKTHKSTAIAAMQQDAGADGFLCGTLDECEALADAGVRNLMYAYPVSTFPALDRVVALGRRCNFFTRVDCLENARLLSDAAARTGECVNCTIIIDSGLHRFGIEPAKAREFADSIRHMPGLCFKGISTHPGHVYAASCPGDVAKYVQEEKNAMAAALRELKKGGYSPVLISSGSTPTFSGAVDDENIGIFHPGNYVFNDVMQLSLGTASEDDCALTVLASVISRPGENLFIIDAGSKTLGLDKGAHGGGAISEAVQVLGRDGFAGDFFANQGGRDDAHLESALGATNAEWRKKRREDGATESLNSLSGYGKVKAHPEAVISGLSEEVGKLTAPTGTTLKVGDRIEIIPNHACVPANLTSWLVLCRGDKVVGDVEVDMRNGTHFVLG